MPSLLERLKSRKLVQWALAYLAGAWLVLQVADYVEGAFGWSPFVRQSFLAIVVVGFLVTLVLAWYHGERGRQRVGGSELLIIAIVLGLGGLAIGSLRSRAAMAPTSETATASAFSPPEWSIAVLPFEDMSAAGDQEWFGDGIAEEILGRLSMLRDVRVVGRTSSFAHREPNRDIPAIGRALDVRTVLEGSVRREGDQVRITARLVDTVDGVRRWGRQYDRELVSVLAVQEEIARAIVDDLGIELRTEESDRLAHRPTENAAAYEQFLRGLQAFNRPFAVGNLQRAIDFFTEATRLDADFADAWAHLGSTYIALGNFRFMEPREAYGEARRHAQRALSLNELHAGAYWTLGWVKLSHDFDPVGGEADFRQVIALDPNSWQGHHGLAFALQMQGRMDEALAAARREFDLDPLNYWPRFALKELHYRRREYAEAREQTEAILEMAPSGLDLAFLGQLEARLGSRESALALADSAVRAAPGDASTELLAALVHAQVGDAGGARRLLEAARARGGEQYVSPGFVAALFTTLGEPDSAFVYLDLARAAYDSWILSLNYPELDPLRGDPRFTELLAALGLSPDVYDVP